MSGVSRISFEPESRNRTRSGGRDRRIRQLISAQAPIGAPNLAVLRAWFRLGQTLTEISDENTAADRNC